MSARPLPRREARPRSRLALSVPEGVPIELELASRGERAVGFVLDALLLLLLLAALTLLLAFAVQAPVGSLAGWAIVVWLLAFFLLRSGGFLWLELRGRGRSPGKRAAGLRIVDAAGAPLTVQALVARNLMREVELWLPLTFVLAPDALLPGLSGPIQLVAGLWVLGLLLFPCFHPSGARLGDLVAGTRVVRAPRALLLPELSASTARAPAERAFTHAHLDVYGIYELQMLEKALRLEQDLTARRATLVQVSQLVRAKVGWRGDERDQDAEPFLRDFYAALRRHLEDRLRLGKRKRDKHDG